MKSGLYIYSQSYPVDSFIVTLFGYFIFYYLVVDKLQPLISIPDIYASREV